MAKALLGHVGIGLDPRATAEIRRLRLVIAGLEAQLADLRATIDLEHSLTLSAETPEPAYS